MEWTNKLMSSLFKKGVVEKEKEWSNKIRTG